MSRIRLICPNCEAQYEVPVDVIPAGGRDVQCSNCSNTWYQNHPDDAAVMASEVDKLIGATEDLEATRTTPVAEGAVPPAPAPAPRSLAPDVADVLREEAEREAQARASETLESQPDLGLEEPDDDEQARRARQARDLMARMRPAEPAAPRAPLPPTQSPGDVAAEQAAIAAGSRRAMLPNVDEINQTLRNSGEPRKVVDSNSGRVSVETDQPRAGFGPGFVLMLVLAALAIGVYVYAQPIADTAPQLAPVIESYVVFVNGLRDWLDAQVTSLLQSLDSMSSEASPEAS